MKLISPTLFFRSPRSITILSPQRLLRKSLGCVAIGLICLLAAPNASAADCAPPPGGLVAWWPGEGDAQDIAGSNDGSLVNGAAFAAGEVGQAFSFDGIDDAVLVPSSAAVSFASNSPMTVELWAYRTGTAGVMHLIGKRIGCGGGGVSEINYQIAFNMPSGEGLTFGPGKGNLAASGLDMPMNTWTHLAGTFDGSKLCLYFNGSLVASQVGMLGYPNADPLLIGGSGACAKFSGLIDEVSIYSRALSAEEIAAIYSVGVSGKCLAPTPPHIYVQPTNQTVIVGDNVSFSAAAGGAPPLAYQWQFNSTNLTGATAAVLTLLNVQEAQAGSYALVVSNGYGTLSTTNVVLTVNPPPACTPPPAGAVAWWPGDHSGVDVAGTNNGTLSGGATLASGKVGQAFSLNGVDGTVIVPDSSSLRLTSEFTLEAWINSRRANGDQPILSKLSYATGNKGYEFVFYNGGLLGLFNSPGQPWPSASVAYGGPMPANVWHHVVFTYDQSAMMLYLNGLPVATNVIGPRVIASSSSSLRIGSVEGNVIYFDGLIDEPTAYNRALSASEIWTIYSARSSGKCMSPFLTAQPRSQVGFWGRSVTFAATAIGTAPLSYQWQRDGVPINGATEASLVLTNLQMADAGAYTVVVTSPYGITTSAPAYLTMNPAGVSLALYAGITIDGVVGLTYGIQYSTDLNNTNSWQGLANVTLSVPTMLWFDMQPASQPQRYYRVLPGPITIP